MTVTVTGLLALAVLLLAAACWLFWQAGRFLAEAQRLHFDATSALTRAMQARALGESLHQAIRAERRTWSSSPPGPPPPPPAVSVSLQRYPL